MMIRNLIFLVGLISSLLFTGCGDKYLESQSSESRVQKLAIELEGNTLTLSMIQSGKHGVIPIKRGSGLYELLVSKNGIVDAKIETKSKILVTALKAGAGELALVDKEWKDTIRIPVVVEPVKPFTLNTDKATLDLDKEKEIKVMITSGNGIYKVEPLSKEVQGQLEVSLSDKEITITATGSTRLNTELKITDLATGNQLKFPLSVLPASIPHQKNLDLIISKQEWNKKTKEEQERIIEGHIKNAEHILQQVKGLKSLPKDKFNYKEQTAAFEDGERIFGGKKNAYSAYKQSRGQSLYDVYNDIYVYGVGFFTVEHLARQAEEFRTRYPDNQDISKLCGDAFNGIYATQEGNTFVHGANNETIKIFNQIVDIVNKLERR